MRLAERYHKLPPLLRKGLIEQAVELVPEVGPYGKRISRAKRFMRAAGKAKVDRYLRWVSTFDSESKLELYSPEFARRTNEFSAADLLKPWFAHANGSGIVDAVLLTDTMTYLPNDLLVKVDIASMAVSLEARSPFLDHHVIEFAASLPESLKLRGVTTKYLLKRMLKRLLPAENLERKKMGFGVPIGHWFRGELQGFLRETLLSERALKRNLFKRESIARLIELHTRGERDFAHQLWTLLMLELWFQRFID
jgi:asparagine synthase (glutamine-hydrolysing)